jgi:hypothetical protein
VGRRIADLAVLRHFCILHSADFSLACGSRRVRGRTDSYDLEGLCEPRSVPRVSAIRILRFGRFGNNVIQLLQAIHIARKIKTERIYIGEVNIGNLTVPFRHAGLELIPSVTPEAQELVLTGHFYHRFCFGHLFSDFDDKLRLAIMADYIRPMMAGVCVDAAGSSDVLHIHIRSGDIFENSGNHTGYVQPPLAYYAQVIRHAALNFCISKVVLVFEDKKNPCVDALVNYLSLSPLRFETHSGCMHDDLRVLASARHMAVGITSFAPLIGLIFNNLLTIYGFRILPFRSLFNAQCVRSFVVKDVAGQYIHSGEWHNTKEQRRRMLQYPFAALTIGDDDNRSEPGAPF